MTVHFINVSLYRAAYLFIALAGCEKGFEGRSKSNDVEKAAGYQALQNNHHGILRRRWAADSSVITEL